jgi:hypothetical protein
MDAPKNTHLESHRRRRRTVFPGVLLLVAVTSILVVPSAGAADAAPDTVSEVAATAGSVPAPVTAPASGTATAPGPSAPTPAPAASTPAPLPSPASVAEPATGVVDRPAGSASGSAASQVVREPAHQAAEAVDAVAEGSSVTHVPIVEDSTRRGGEVAGSVVESVAEGTGTAEAPRDSQDPGAGTGTSRKGKAGPAPPSNRAGPPSPSPQPAGSALPLSIPQVEGDLLAPKTGSAVAFVYDARGAMGALVSAFSEDDAGRPPAGSRNAPPLPSPVGIAASSPLGGGSGSSILLLGLLAVFTLAAPRTLPRLLPAAARYRPARSICALERPG